MNVAVWGQQRVELARAQVLLRREPQVRVPGVGTTAVDCVHLFVLFPL